MSKVTIERAHRMDGTGEYYFSRRIREIAEIPADYEGDCYDFSDEVMEKCDVFLTPAASSVPRVSDMFVLHSAALPSY